MKYKAAPSSCGIIKDNVVHTRKSSACLRYRWFRYIPNINIERLKIPEEYSQAGEFWESYIEQELKDSGKTYIREAEVNEKIQNFWIRGYIDFDRPCSDLIIECKALASSARRLQIIRKGVPDKSHIYQVVLYLLAQKRSKGELRYAYVHYKDEDSKEWVAPKDTEKGKNRRTFIVSLSQEGKILVDYQPWDGPTLWEILKYVEEHQTSLKNRNTLPSRPFQDPSNPWKTPCKRCVFSEVCDKYDRDLLFNKDTSIKEIETAAKIAVKNYVPHEAKIYIPKLRRKKKSSDKSNNKGVQNA